MKVSLFKEIMKIAVRPHLWVVAVTQLWHLRKKNWYKSFPFMPIPSKEYLQFRLLTAYGNEDPGEYIEKDLITYLKWSRGWKTSAR
ncbi:MAG: hypothetical protein CL470_08735 [Acidimicrobiaceae bacterium]|nr:hypothetical protein [Acidimicrobiaceae bacterium]